MAAKAISHEEFAGGDLRGYVCWTILQGDASENLRASLEAALTVLEKRLKTDDTPTLVPLPTIEQGDDFKVLEHATSQLHSKLDRYERKELPELQLVSWIKGQLPRLRASRAKIFGACRDHYKRLFHAARAKAESEFYERDVKLHTSYGHRAAAWFLKVAASDFKKEWNILRRMAQYCEPWDIFNFYIHQMDRNVCHTAYFGLNGHVPGVVPGYWFMLTTYYLVHAQNFSSVRGEYDRRFTRLLRLPTLAVACLDEADRPKESNAAASQMVEDLRKDLMEIARLFSLSSRTGLSAPV